MGKAASGAKVTPALANAECCPHCEHQLSDDWIKAAHSRVAGRRGGRPQVSRACPYCKEKFGARELREHIPRCDKAPKRTPSQSPLDSSGKLGTKRVSAHARKRRTGG